MSTRTLRTIYIMMLLAIAVCCLILLGCSNTESKPEIVDPPECWPNCNTKYIPPGG